jgi:hypothetical protein
VRSRRPRGNAPAAPSDNYLVHALAELMDVVRDLCRFAASFRLAGRVAWAEALIEQCADLLAHRARLLTERRRGGPPSPGGFRSPLDGSEWTN